MGAPFEVAIIGAGPAGIAAAVSAAHYQIPHVLFEKGQLANTIYEYQKAKLVMAEPRKLPLRARVNFQEGNREAILETWQRAVAEAGVNICNAEVTRLRKNGAFFEITHGDDVSAARNVVLSLGVQGTPRKLGAPGEELPHVVYSLADPDEWKDMDIVVVGAGDSAIENALALARHNRVIIINRSAEFARAKDANARLITDAIQSKTIRCFANSTVQRIEPDRIHIETPEGIESSPCQRVIVRAGAVPPRKFLESCGITFPSKDAAAVPLVDSKYQSNVPGLFLVGALIGYPLIKQAMNQGHEVIEHILGHEVEPADAVLIRERLEHLPGTVDDNYRFLRGHLPMFSDLSEPQFRELLIDSTVHVKQPGEVIFARNDYTDTFYSIVSGAVEIQVAADRAIHLVAGMFFGELGLVSGRRRSATVVADAPCVLLETPRKQILKLISSVASVKRRIDRAFVLRTLEGSIFPDVDPVFLAELALKAQLKNFKKGEAIFKEGDAGDALYVIRRGSVKISQKDVHGVDITRAYFSAGNCVGEIALLSDEDSRRTASVTAVVGCETIVIQKSDFRALIATDPKVQERFRALAELRKISDATREHNRKQGAVLDFMFGEGITDASNVLVIDSDLCVSCDNCETACAATHDGDSRLDRKGGKFFAAVQVPISCRHCENPLCMIDCPPDALARKPDGEIVIRDSCIGCGNCSTNCPYGVITMTHEKDKSLDVLAWLGFRKRKEGPAKAAKCDMCSSLSAGPACVRACPTGAAVRINPNELSNLMRRKGGMH